MYPSTRQLLQGTEGKAAPKASWRYPSTNLPEAITLLASVSTAYPVFGTYINGPFSRYFFSSLISDFFPSGVFWKRFSHCIKHGSGRGLSHLTAVWLWHLRPKYISMFIDNPVPGLCKIAITLFHRLMGLCEDISCVGCEMELHCIVF